MQRAIDLCHDPKAEPRVQRPRRIVRVNPKLQACVAALQRGDPIVALDIEFHALVAEIALRRPATPRIRQQGDELHLDF